MSLLFVLRRRLKPIADAQDTLDVTNSIPWLRNPTPKPLPEIAPRITVTVFQQWFVWQDVHCLWFAMQTATVWKPYHPFFV